MFQFIAGLSVAFGIYLSFITVESIQAEHIRLWEGIVLGLWAVGMIVFGGLLYGTKKVF